MEKLIQEKIITEQKGLYWILRKKKSPNKKNRKTWLSFIQREKISQKKINLARKALRFFTLIPGLKGLFICGSVARKVSSTKSDIDFLILTRKNRVWTTRFLLTILTFFLGHKTIDKQSRQNKFCLNHFRSENKLSLEKYLQKLYPAEEYAQMINLYSEKKIIEKFYRANQVWMRKILPYFNFIKPPLYSRETSLAKNNFLGNWIEKFLYYLQIQKINHHNQQFQKLDKQRIVIDNEVIMFHLNPK